MRHRCRYKYEDNVDVDPKTARSRTPSTQNEAQKSSGEPLSKLYWVLNWGLQCLWLRIWEPQRPYFQGRTLKAGPWVFKETQATKGFT